MKYLKWLVPIIIFLLIIISLSINFSKKTEEVTLPKKTANLTFADEKIGYISIHDIHINELNDYYIVMAKLTNLTADQINYNNIIIYAKDNNKLVMTLTGYFGGFLLGDETKSVVIKTKKNLSKIDQLEFEFKD